MIVNPVLPAPGESGYDECLDALMASFHVPEDYADRILRCIRGAIEIYELEQAKR